MSILYKTPYSPSEVKSIMGKALETNTFYNWHKDAYIGRATEKKIRYTFHKAYIRNSFEKVLIGRVYKETGETFIEIRLTSALLDLNLILKIHFFMSIMITLSYLMHNSSLTIIGVMVRLFFSGLFFSGFTTIVGVIVNLIPTSEKNRRCLTRLIEEKLLAIKV